MGHLKFDVANGILHIILSGSNTGNSIGQKEANQILKLCKDKKSLKDVEGVIIRSTHPKIFCAGGNLNEHLGFKTRFQGIKVARNIRKALGALSELKIPVVAIVGGDCFGGGLELITCADYVIATSGAYIGFWQKKIGLTFGWGGGGRLLKRIPLKKVLQLALQSRSLSAYEAKNQGIVDQIAPESLTIAFAEKWIKDVVAQNVNTMEEFKKWSEKSEQNIFEKLWMKNDHKLKIEKMRLGS